MCIPSHESHRCTLVLVPCVSCCGAYYTCASVVAGLVHFALEEFQSHDGVNGDHEEDQKGDVKKWKHGLQDGIHHYLQAWGCDMMHLEINQIDIPPEKNIC